MGGRGGSSGITNNRFINLSAGQIEKRMSDLDSKIRRDQTTASLKSSNYASVRRRANLAESRIEKNRAEYEELEKAFNYVKKRKRNVPF